MKTNANIIDFVLTFDWYDKIKSGEKTHEYRKLSIWEKRLKQKICEFEHEHKPLWLRLHRGYTKETMLFQVKYILVNNGLMTDLKVNELVYDFTLGEKIN